MRIYRNLDYIKKRETLGRRLFLVAVMSLATGLMVSFTPNMEVLQTAAAQNPVLGFIAGNYAILSFATLIIGFLTASTGSYFINRFSPRRWPRSKLLERPDEVFARTLRGLDHQYTLFFWVFPSVAHLLVGPCGLVAFVVRSDKGRIMVKGDRWREPFTFARLFMLFAREGLGNPSREIEDSIREIRRTLDEFKASQLTEEECRSIPVTGAVAFIHGEVDLEREGPTVPVLTGPKILDFVRQTTKKAEVKNSVMRQFQKELETYLGTAQLETEEV